MCFFKVVWEPEDDLISLNMLLNWSYTTSCLIKIVVMRLYWCVYSNTSIWEVWNASEKMQRRWNCGMRLNFLLLISKGRLLSGTVCVLHLFDWLFCHGTCLHSIGFCKYENLMIAQCGMIHSACNMCNVGYLVCNRYIDGSDYELQKFVKD